jgi:hypothetical protein
MLTATQIAAIIMLLNAFGVPPATVEYVRVQISAPQIQATTTQQVATTTPAVGDTQTRASLIPASVTPLLIPLCTLSVHEDIKPNGRTYAVLDWKVNAQATALSITSDNGYAWNPTRLSVSLLTDTPSLNLTDTNAVNGEVFTLTETMSDPTYQPTTTCSATGNIPYYQK